MATFEERLAKMPSFVREHVASLEAKVADLKAQLEVSRAEKTRVQIVNWGDYNNNQSLAEDSRVRFYLDPLTDPSPDYIDVQLDRDNKKHLALSSSFGQLVFMPSASNTVYLKSIRHRDIEE